MTWNISNIANTDTFQKWLDTTNYLVNAVSTAAVTVGNAAVGSAGITGTFAANTVTTNNITINANLSVNAISVGNSTTNAVANSSSLKISNSTANVILTIPTTTQISNGQYYHNANGSWTIVAVPYQPVTSGQTNTSGTSLQLIDSYAIASYKAAEYIISVVDNVVGANNYYITKILTGHSGGANSFSTEYGSITTNNSVGVFSVNSDSTTISLNFTPVSTNTTVKFIRTVV